MLLIRPNTHKMMSVKQIELDCVCGLKTLISRNAPQRPSEVARKIKPCIGVVQGVFHAQCMSLQIQKPMKSLMLLSFISSHIIHRKKDGLPNVLRRIMIKWWK